MRVAIIRPISAARANAALRPLGDSPAPLAVDAGSSTNRPIVRSPSRTGSSMPAAHRHGPMPGSGAATTIRPGSMPREMRVEREWFEPATLQAEPLDEPRGRAFDQRLPLLRRGRVRRECA